MKRIVSGLAVCGLILMAGSAFAEDEREEKVPLSDVPAKVLEAAKNAVPGITISKAEVEKTRKGLVYELEGALDETEYEIEVSADGKVLDIDKEYDHEGDGDDGDHHGDNDDDSDEEDDSDD